MDLILVFIFTFTIIYALVYCYLKNRQIKKTINLINYLNIDLLDVFKSDKPDADKFISLISEKITEKSTLLLYRARRIFLELGHCDSIMSDFLKKESIRAINELLNKVQNDHTTAVYTVQIEMISSKKEELMNKYPEIFSKIIEYNFEAIRFSETIEFVEKRYTLPKPLLFKINFVVID